MLHIHTLLWCFIEQSEIIEQGLSDMKSTEGMAIKMEKAKSNYTELFIK